MHRHFPPRSTRLKQRSFPPGRLCCPLHLRYYLPLRLLTRPRLGLHDYGLIPNLPRAVDPRPREVSRVALMALPAFRSPYAGGFLEAALPESSPLPWAFAIRETLGSRLLPLPGLTFRRCRIPFMVRTTELLSLPRRLPRFATPGRPGAAAACYVALWRLPRPDFHRLVIRTFHGAPRGCWAADYRQSSLGSFDAIMTSAAVSTSPRFGLVGRAHHTRTRTPDTNVDGGT